MRYKIGLLMFFVILSFSFYAQTQTGKNILSMNEFSNENVSTKKKESIVLSNMFTFQNLQCLRYF